jgi:hypothetical protein
MSLTANLTQGAIPPPPGVVPNFVDSPSQATVTKIILGFCLVLITVLVVLRSVAKWAQKLKFEWDDGKCQLAYLELS